MRAIDRKLYRDLIHLRGQVIAIALVIACGIAAFVSMRSIYFSLLETQAAYYAEYRFANVFANLKRAPDRLATEIEAIPGVGAAQTRIVANVTLDVAGVTEPARGRILSIPEQRQSMLNDLYLAQGRYIEPGKRDEVLVSEAFARANELRPGDRIPAIINGRWEQLRIVGIALSPEYVYEIGGGEMFPDSRRFGVLWMSRQALGPLFNLEGGFNDVAISLSPGADEAKVIDALDALLEPYGTLGAYGREDQVSHHFITNEIAELRVTSTFIPAVFLGVTAFLLHLVLSRLVATERDQIAVMKAFGYDNVEIGFHYLKLSFAAVLLGVLLGIAGGWWFGYTITALYTEFFHFPILRYSPGLGVILTAVVISLLAAAVGALASVRRAVDLPPAEAMRPEAPARFRAGWIERAGLGLFLSPSLRMIVRNLSRRPVKAALSSLGISLSVALLVTGFYLYYDAIDRVIDVMFGAVYREDVSVIFNEPLSAGARHEIERLPGVIRAEAHRSVPARLRHGHRMRRIALMGLEKNADLWRVVDSDFQAHEPPDHGVLLSAKLADTLGVRPGDVLRVEVLEGARPVSEIPVAGTVDDLIGMSAYLEIESLNRLMREGGTISGMHLMIDDRSRTTLFSTLKTTPAVRSVIVPGALLENFNQTIARTMSTSTGTLIFFACIIAFGVVYNSARIALSERAREFASLRILGFTVREIGVILLGEQAILTLIALPVGWAMGYGISWLITWAIDTELMRLPLVISGRTWARATIIVIAAAFFSGLLVARRLKKLDLVEVLKTRE